MNTLELRKRAAQRWIADTHWDDIARSVHHLEVDLEDPACLVRLLRSLSEHFAVSADLLEKEAASARAETSS